jgi:hypothetical protein
VKIFSRSGFECGLASTDSEYGPTVPVNKVIFGFHEKAGNIVTK